MLLYLRKIWCNCQWTVIVNTPVDAKSHVFQYVIRSRSACGCPVGAARSGINHSCQRRETKKKRGRNTSDNRRRVVENERAQMRAKQVGRKHASIKEGRNWIVTVNVGARKQIFMQKWLITTVYESICAVQCIVDGNNKSARLTIQLSGTLPQLACWNDISMLP